MKNPLNKRLPRELKQEFSKYLVIFLLMTLVIGFVSGFLVADESMITAYHESFEKYHVEDGHFETQKALNKAQRKRIEGLNIDLYDLYFSEEIIETPSNTSKLRLFKNRTEVNKACVMAGRLAEKSGEIAIDRMWADNNKLHIGDTITSKDHTWKIVGTVALSDYSTMFENNSDSMFDAIKFGVAVITEEDFETDKNQRYVYAFRYLKRPKDEAQENDMATDLMDDLNEEIKIEEFVPRYLNQAIRFTGDDMGSDKAMMILLLYIMIAIMAFVFAVTITNTIIQEANVIGTLRASGYTKQEIIVHYMKAPILVTLAAAVVGNILGYTVFKKVCAFMYYNSYSLPTYITIWNMNAFIETTLIPIAMMIVINFVILKRKLDLSPLKFIRRDLSRRKQRKAIRLPHKIPFFSRFRMRVISQNRANYAVLFIGIMFANLLLLFGLALPDIIHNYQEDLQKNLIANYQYMLKIPVDAVDDDHPLQSTLNMMMFMNEVNTDNPDAEKFSAYTLATLGDMGKQEDIVFYGVKDHSKYIDIKETDDVYISKSYAEKYYLKKGDSITLKEKYKSDQYTFKVSGIYDYDGAVCIFMNKDKLNETFDLGKQYFSGYFSDSKITDIDKDHIGTVIDFDALSKISRQLEHSMGNFMYMVQGIAIIIFMILIYLLSKTIIEKNAQSISMTKILGYNNKEISQLYIVSTSIMVILSVIITAPLVFYLLKPIFVVMMREEMTGWITFNVSLSVFIRVIVYGIITYSVIAYLEYKRIQRVPMEEALKNVE